MRCRVCNKVLDPFSDDTLAEMCWEHSSSNPNNKVDKSSLYGWICPRCMAVHSPFVLRCDCPASYITKSNTNTE